jgi:hypothetical protein
VTDFVRGTNVRQFPVTDLAIRPYIYETSTVALTFLDNLLFGLNVSFPFAPYFKNRDS